MRRVIVALATALAIVTTSACGGGSPASTLPQGSESFKVDPADSRPRSTTRTGRRVPGSHWVYRETNADGDVQRNDVVVTNETKTIMGIERSSWTTPLGRAAS
jgi:hypothetical protein